MCCDVITEQPSFFCCCRVLLLLLWDAEVQFDANNQHLG
jgi:hypothetical protein